MKNLNMTTVIGWGITIIIAVAAGTFALTKYYNEQAIKALEQRVAIAEQHSKAGPSQVIRTKEVPSGLNNQEMVELTSRLKKLEDEKRDLIEKISKNSVLTLDPRSELSILIAQLESDEKDERAKAIQGLFMLKDPVSFLPLRKYFEARPDEVTEGENPYIGKWFSLFIEVGGIPGIEFVVSQLESTERL